MSCWTLRILTYLALVSIPFANGAEAGVVGSTGSWSGYLSPLQTVQFNSFGSNCYYADGWNGRGWYQCGDELNTGFGWVGPFNNFGGPAARRHHRRDVFVAHPQAPNPIYPGATSRRLGVGVPSAGLPGGAGAPAFGNRPRFRQFGAAGVHTAPGLHVGAALVSPGSAGRGLRSGFSGGNFHQFHGAGFPHIGAPGSPGFAGVGTFHGFGAAGVPHIAAPVSPRLAGVGTFHVGGAFGAPHIGAPASPGFAGVGFHGVGGAGTFQGGGAGIGVGGIGHR